MNEWGQPPKEVLGLRTVIPVSAEDARRRFFLHEVIVLIALLP